MTSMHSSCLTTVYGYEVSAHTVDVSQSIIINVTKERAAHPLSAHSVRPQSKYDWTREDQRTKSKLNLAEIFGAPETFRMEVVVCPFLSEI
jgi:hypothetical protein